MAGGEVQLVDLVKRFGDFTAVAGINLQMPSGEFFSLLGPSGCGKTTTLRMIAGFERPTEGQILLDGVDMAQVPPHKRNVNTVFQNYALFPHLTVEENVAFGLRYQNASKAETTRRVGDALELVQLTGFGKRRPTQLSGGQQQRVALARALILNPAVLLLDEPLGALDAKLRKRLQVELKTLQQEVGITFIYVTHDQEEALTMSDRIAVMSQGQRGAGRAAARDLRGTGHRVRRGFPRRLQPDGVDGRRAGRRWVSGEGRGIRADRGRGGHDHRRVRPRSPSGRNVSTCRRERDRSQPRAGHGRADRLRRLRAPCVRESRPWRADPGMDPERRGGCAVRAGDDGQRLLPHRRLACASRCGDGARDENDALVAS